MKKTYWIQFFGILTITLCIDINAQMAVGNATEKPYFAVPIYECIGVYYRSEDRGDCQVEYRNAEGGEWRESLGLVYDPRDKEYRGSLVGLEPDTPYDIRLTCGGEITDPVVTVSNPIVDSGVRIPGFNDDYAGKAPDLGAFELGRPPLRFGRRVQGNIWAPWELK